VGGVEQALHRVEVGGAVERALVQGLGLGRIAEGLGGLTGERQQVADVGELAGGLFQDRAGVVLVLQVLDRGGGELGVFHGARDLAFGLFVDLLGEAAVAQHGHGLAAEFDQRVEVVGFLERLVQ